MSDKFGDNVDNPKLADAIVDAMEAERARVRTVIPGRIISYDSSTQKATVRPVVQSSYKDEQTGERRTTLPPAIPECPVNFPQGSDGGFAITWPLKSGDPVEIRIASRSLEKWQNQGGTDVEPDNFRRHDLTDAIVDPGIRSFVNALGDDAVQDNATVIKSDKQIHLGTADPVNWVARDDRVESELQKIRDKLSTLKTAFEAHTHTVLAQPGPNPTTLTTNPTTSTAPSGGKAGDVASDKVKTE